MIAIEQNVSITMKAGSWCILIGLLANINDNTGIAEKLIDQILDAIEGKP